MLSHTNIKEFAQQKITLEQKVDLPELEEKFGKGEEIKIDMMQHKGCLCCKNMDLATMQSPAWTGAYLCNSCESIMFIIFSDRMGGSDTDSVLIFKKEKSMESNPSEEERDNVYQMYLQAFKSADQRMKVEDLDHEKKPLSHVHFHLKAQSDAKFKNKWFPQEKILAGEMPYKIEIKEQDEHFNIIVHFQQSNENNLASLTAVKVLYEQTLATQMQPGPASQKMNKQELKELQIALAFLNKHIEILNAYVQKKYKDAVPEEDKKVKLLGKNDIAPKDLRV